VNWAAVAFIVAVTALAGALVAVIPLLNVSRISPGQAVREEGRSGTAGRSATIARRVLVTTQVAFAFMLLIGAGLLFASFRQILRIDSGFDPTHVLSGMISLPDTTYRDEEHVRSFVSRALDRISALPGVEPAGFTSSVPFGENYGDSVILAEGYIAQPGESLISPSQIRVSPGYFETLRVPLRRGRFFDRRDQEASQAVIIVSERLAQKFWAGQDPIGKRMYQPGSAEEVASGPGPRTRWLTIVGVVGDVKQRGYISQDERLGAYYFPHAQSPSRNMALVARASGDPLALASSIRREIAAMDPELPFFDVHSMEQRLEESVAGRRTAMLLAVTFGIIARLLATVGIYGVLAYQVTQRTREIGIRMAPGSDAGHVFALILREGVLLLVVGFTLGLSGAFAMRRALAGELYGVGSMDPAVLASVAAVLAVVALAACALPARRASRIDPVIALAE
jgi:putative ABC transport system permease protein